MLVGVPREIKESEFRVGLIPETIAELTRRKHRVMVETGAGIGAGISDQDYEASGAEIVSSPDEVFRPADLIVKVKEPLAGERIRLRRGQVLFTYLHLAADPEQVRDLLACGVTAIGYETVSDAAGRLPLLAPMSEVAGRMAPQVGAHFLERPHGTRGVLLAGVPGVAPARVLILGAGIVGTNAALIASSMGADVTALARSPESLRRLDERFGARVHTGIATFETIGRLCREADLVIAGALVPGALAPKLVTAAMVKTMQPGSVIVDVSIDQGGCAETSRVTSHLRPTYEVDGVVHYCVPNMPGAVPRTSTFALNAATRPHVLALADQGWRRAMSDNEHLRNGLNIHDGKVTCRPVADALGLALTPLSEALAS